MACLHCRRPYDAKTGKARYCSGRCRAAASRKRRDQALAAALAEAERAMERMRAMVRGKIREEA